MLSNLSPFSWLSAFIANRKRALVERERSLARQNAELERRVRERTEELERANEELRRLARRDPLTGLFNRRASDEKLREEIVRHVRSERAFAVLLIDVDHFKRVNDASGHAAGDDVLRRVGKLLVSSCRRSDFVARWGGEEFLVLLPETDIAGARCTAEKIRAAVREERIWRSPITVSVGIALFRGEAIDGDTLVARADTALYEAKSSGRDRVVAEREERKSQPSSVFLRRRLV